MGSRDSKQRQEEHVLSKFVCLRPIDGLTGQQNRKRKWSEDSKRERGEARLSFNLNLAHGSQEDMIGVAAAFDLPLLSSPMVMPPPMKSLDHRFFSAIVITALSRHSIVDQHPLGGCFFTLSVILLKGGRRGGGQRGFQLLNLSLSLWALGPDAGGGLSSGFEETASQVGKLGVIFQT